MKKWNEGSDAYNGKDTMPHEDLHMEQDLELQEDVKKYPEEDSAVKVDAPRQGGRRNRPVMEVVDLNEPEKSQLGRRSASLRRIIS